MRRVRDGERRTHRVESAVAEAVALEEAAVRPVAADRQLHVYAYIRR